MRFFLFFIWFSPPFLLFGETLSSSQESDAFTFIRIQYNNVSSGNYGDDLWGSTWSFDYPSADINFMRGVTRLTNIHINAKPEVLSLDNDTIFDYPFLYMLELGRNGGPSFSPKEIKNLREYLLRGGFLLIDDFWGGWEWSVFYHAFSKVFPDRALVELDKTHPIFHIFYDIDGAQMIPGRWNGYASDWGVSQAVNRAVLDDDGRVMVLINWNSDMGDGWEHTYDPDYPTQYTNLAYQLGINYLVYAMTH